MRAFFHVTFKVSNPKAQQGLALIELALVLPFFLSLVFGVITYGLALYNQAVITNASREAARAGVMFTVPAASDADIVATALDYCAENLVTLSEPSTPEVQLDYAEGRKPGDPLTVNIHYAYTGLAFAPGPTSLLLHARATMRFE